ncbi:MAG: hypothetical protein L6R43_19970, partial [Planctomycetes bacterium]|nr:hypothetical protein [Planctomycetota bacterium]
RLAAALRPPAAAAAALLLLPGAAVLLPSPAGAAEEERPAEVLLLGAPREGPLAELGAALRERGLRVAPAEDLPATLDPSVGVLLLGRGPRGAEEGGAWREALRSFLRAGGRAAAAPGPAGDLLLGAAEPGVLGLAHLVPDRGAVPLAAALLAPTRTLLPHPAAGPSPGLAPALFRVPFPREPRSLPGRVLAYLGVLAAGFAGLALAARRRGLGQGRAAAAVGGLATLGGALLFLPGLGAGEFREARLVLEERASPGAATGRRLEVLRVERTAAGEGEFPLPPAAGAVRAEVAYGEGAERALGPDGRLRLAAPGRWALVASVSGVDTPAAAGPFLAAMRVRGGRAWDVPGGAVTGQAPGEGEGEPLDRALAAWRRSEDPRVARAGGLFAACLRAGGEDFTLAVPAAGVDGVVVRGE